MKIVEPTQDSVGSTLHRSGTVVDKTDLEEQYTVLAKLYMDAKNQLLDIKKKLKVLHRHVQGLMDKSEVRKVLENIMKGKE